MINEDDDHTLPDPEDLPEVLLLVLRGGDDDGAVQQVQGDPVRARVAGAPGGQHGEDKSEDCDCSLSSYLILVMPLLVAITTTGARSSSSALLRKEKHSMSSMCT